MPTKTLLGFSCLRCGHEWVARVPKPKRCPACTSARWNEAKTS